MSLNPIATSILSVISLSTNPENKPTIPGASIEMKNFLPLIIWMAIGSGFYPPPPDQPPDRGEGRVQVSKHYRDIHEQQKY